MLEDRDYMRRGSGGVMWSVTVVLIIVNAAVFLLENPLIAKLVPIDNLRLSLEGIQHGFVWQLLTFQFLHGGLAHLVFNCLALYMFGRDVESIFGRSHFLALYLISGAVGGLFQVFVAWVWPQYFSGPVVGASAGVFGVVAAYAMLYPERTLLLFFVIPMPAKMLLLLELVFAAIGIAFPQTNGIRVAHSAHLGGMLAGLAFLRWTRRAGSRPWAPFQKTRRKRELVKAMSFKLPHWPGSKTDDPADLPSEEFISREVDPILDKISAHGIQSLTDRERKILEAARSKMRK